MRIPPIWRINQTLDHFSDTFFRKADMVQFYVLLVLRSVFFPPLQYLLVKGGRERHEPSLRAKGLTVSMCFPFHALWISSLVHPAVVSQPWIIVFALIWFALWFGKSLIYM